MNDAWNFTGLEFQVLCDKYRDGHLPAPLFYTLEEPMSVDQFDRLKEKTWVELRAKWDLAWESMIDAICAPQLFISVRAWDELELDDPTKQRRIHFARSGAQGFKIDQILGKSPWHADAFVVTECDPHDLAGAVVRSLPDVGAGRLPNTRIIIDPQEHVSGGTGSVFRDDDEDSPTTASTKFFQLRASQTGTVLVVQGRSKFGPRGIHETHLLWRDVIDDGRYVMAMDDAPVAVATGPQQFAVRIQQHINHLMERVETHWEYGRPEDRY